MTNSGDRFAEFNNSPSMLWVQSCIAYEHARDTFGFGSPECLAAARAMKEARETMEATARTVQRETPPRPETYAYRGPYAHAEDCNEREQEARDNRREIFYDTDGDGDGDDLPF